MTETKTEIRRLNPIEFKYLQGQLEPTKTTIIKKNEPFELKCSECSKTKRDNPNLDFMSLREIIFCEDCFILYAECPNFGCFKRLK